MIPAAVLPPEDEPSAGPEAPHGSEPFLLAGEWVWRVTSGHVEVFAVRLRDGQPDGPRTHLVHVTEGQALFGSTMASGAPWGLLVVGTLQTRLVKAPMASLAAGIDELVAPWAEHLYGAMSRGRLAPLSAEIAAGQEIELAEHASLRARGELVWLRQVEGHACLMGQPELVLDAEFVPLTRAAWLEASSASRIAAVDTQGLSTLAEVWCGLQRLHELTLRYAARAAESADDAARARLAQGTVFRHTTLRDAFERLADSMTWRAAQRSPAAGHAGRGDPLLAACSLIGEALGLRIEGYPQPAEGSAPRDPLAAILRSSRVRARQVALRGEWWREDSGPLLAFQVEGRHPVALLRPKASGAYLLVDPTTRAERVVDRAVAEQLEPFAQALYRPFPERALRLRDLVRFGAQGSARDLLTVLGVAIAGALLGMVPSMATATLFNSVIPGAQRAQLLQMTVVLVACAATNALFSLTSSVALLRLDSRGGAALQAAVWDRLLALPLPFFRAYNSGELAVRAMSIEAIRQVVSGATISALVGLVMAAGNFYLMFSYSSAMAPWAAAIIGIVLALTAGGSYLQLRPQRDAVRLQSKTSGLVLQLLSSIAKLRVAAAEVHAFALWVRHFSAQRRVQYQSRRVANWLTAFNGAVPMLSNLLIFYLALPLISEARSLQAGDFLGFLAAFTACSSAAIGASLALLNTFNTIPLYEQAKPILQALPEVDVGKTDPGVLTGDIEVQHAMFRYQAEGPLVLRDVSFHIRAGEFVAFVGPSGSGKSTLLRILLGFEALEGGSVYYDRQELGGLDVQAVRRQMGVVLQSGRLMSGELYKNIVGATAASLDDAWSAAEMAGLAEEIRAMPMGMHTVVSEGGGTLSGGQRQRLLIARAIVGRPRILLFDEATSALDNRTQAIVSRSLEALQATRIVVAHRLSTIINADRIFVMDKGQLTRAGTYAELMTQDGSFAELAKRQIA